MVEQKRSDGKICGTFELSGNGSGHLRLASANYRVQASDARVSAAVSRALRLRGGETILTSAKKPPGKQVLCIAKPEEVESINERSIDEHIEATPFEELTAINPQERIRFETPGGPLAMRVVDLMTPIGLGQRGLIVAAPRTGKTVLLQQMAAGIAANHPDIYMMVLLINERPEEVTDMRRSVHGEVVASSSDHDIADHVRLARLMTKKAKSMVESGRDVLVLLDSLTRVGRAFNSNIRGRGRILSGGLDIGALTEPKAIFGSARNIENGGSLTIIASCLIETGSRMDDVIFNEFKGTGNMEIVLSRELANRRIWPAIDLQQSGTRKEELLLSGDELELSHGIRRTLLSAKPVHAMETLLKEMGKHEHNRAMIASIAGRRAS